MNLQCIGRNITSDGAAISGQIIYISAHVCDRTEYSGQWSVEIWPEASHCAGIGPTTCIVVADVIINCAFVVGLF